MLTTILSIAAGLLAILAFSVWFLYEVFTAPLADDDGTIINENKED